MTSLFFLGHIVLGAYFIISGLRHFINMKDMVAYGTAKHAPSPSVTVPLTGAMLLLGGLGVFFQTYLVPSYWLLIAFLVLAAFFMHRFWKVTDPMMRGAERVNFEKNLALAAALLMIVSVLMV